MKKYVDKILIIAGVVIIIFAVFIKSSVQQKQNELVEIYDQYIDDIEDDDSISLKRGSIDTAALEKADKKLKEEDDIPVNMYNIIGILNIPKIDLSVTVAEGTDNATLKYSVGHFEGTAMPGEQGNFCLVGHRSYTYGEYFNRLDEIEIGDSIIIKKDKKVYTYKVNAIKVVEPEEVSVLNQYDKKEITLITCTPIRVATHRLIVKGELVKCEDA